MKRFKQIVINTLPWVAATMATNAWAGSAIWDKAGDSIDSMSDLTNKTSEGFAWMFKIFGAGLCVAVLLVAGYHTLTAFHEAREKGSYATFAVWLLISIFLVGIVVVLGSIAFNSAGEISSIDGGS